jgi:hypothetical protein
MARVCSSRPGPASSPGSARGPSGPTFDKNAAAEHARTQAADTYEEAKEKGNGQTFCARYVRLAIEAGGIRVEPTGLAKDYGPGLIAAGFEEVRQEAYMPMTGDVIVFQGTSSTAAGHMQIYDGIQWISDFKQKDPLWPSSNPKSPWQTEKPTYNIYRYSDQ